MNPLVEDLVRATTTFGQRPNFKDIHKNNEHKREGDNDNAGDKEEGMEMSLYRMHPEDRKIAQQLREIAEDPLTAATAAAAAAAANAGGIHAIPLITGDIRRLESFRRNWLAAADHLNRALQILTVESNEDLEGARKGDDTAMQTYKCDVRISTVLMSASQLLAHMRTLVNHSYYVDSMPAIFEHFYEPYEVWWFRDNFIETFYDCIEGESEDGRETKYSLAFLWFPTGLPLATR